MDHYVIGKARMLGVMQGRLSAPVDGRFQFFPRTTWRQEIIDASSVGLDAIEWIYDGFGDGANPIETDDGIAQVRSLSAQYGVVIESICADWFMEELLIGVEAERAEQARIRLAWLLDRARLMGVTRIVLPFVDSSALSDERLVDEAVTLLQSILPLAYDAGVELHIESSLDPTAFAAFLERVQDSCIKVNYDIGNSASLGYDPRKEFLAYGDRIGSVHIKDRELGGGTVPLGAGNADFAVVFEELARVQYQGPFILQTARGVPGSEVGHLRDLVEQARHFIDAYLVGQGL